MKPIRTALLAAGAMVFSTAIVTAAPVSSPVEGQAADIVSRLESKGATFSYNQWRGRGYGRRGYYGRGYYGRGYYGRRRGFGTGALIGGLAAGALIGGAIASQAAPAPVYGAPASDAVSYCMQRFRSYDPASGTYLGNDGIRHSCP